MRQNLKLKKCLRTRNIRVKNLFLYILIDVILQKKYEFENVFTIKNIYILYTYKKKKMSLKLFCMYNI